MRKEKALQEKVAAMRAKKENVCRQRDALKTELSDFTDSTRSDFESSVTESTRLSVWRRFYTPVVKELTETPDSIIWIGE